ncbi:MAG TPA: phosphoglucomutase/phosphomannomutase family protein [Flexilinea sp.]|jgi:phosphomannomutase|nr:MAG: Phosphoglucomutase [Chloroflexi bacterium ADurb.Bin344]HNY93391.1 phosphoglucomutase/phosphomannomutase family protein [Flexilinea sp.]HOG21078.1 phosphoglucomutase/phosphomannomutase family protein [Flexilinea sp.]HOR55175.1 phosphoglucomutase/phosphomannomutase family protein [Flexilinea sp.]HOU20051.1 phosphoglucomutase/phosphomannomutase family protein [Flexilinea sp.]
MSLKIKFGTDGWRAYIAEDYTFDNCRRCAQGFANYLLKKDKKGECVVVGYDKRFHSENFAAACAEVMAGNGFNVLLTQEATPTPVISYAVVDKKAIGAINITASHNPPSDNGFKVRDATGGAIDPQGLLEIEAGIPDDMSDVKRIPLNDGLESGRIEFFDASVNYISHLKDLIDLEPIRKSGLKILVDPMWGNGSGWFKRLLGGDKTEIIEIHNERNPIFPEMKRPEPIPPNIDVALKKTVELGADVLLITDGDADRCGLGDENGVFLNQLQVMALLTLYLLEIRKERGAIVKTLSTTTMLNKLAKIYGVPIYETGVGFKYVAPKFKETDAIIGGEESGGYAFRGNVPERDGILANLYFLDFMVKTGKTPSQLLQWLFEIVGPHYYERIDTSFKGNAEEKKKFILDHIPEKLGGIKVTGLDTTDGFKFMMEDGGWMLIRFSGTEPIIRVYTETTHEDCVDAILKDGLKVAGIE